MKQLRNWSVLAVFIFAVSANAVRAQQSQPAAPHTVDLKSTDGTLLKATFFPAAKAGPGVLLFHQSNRTRTSWDEVSRQLAAAGINTLTIDERGYGESGGKKEARELYHDADLDSAFEYLVSQPGVDRNAIGGGEPDGWASTIPLKRHGVIPPK